MKANLAAYFGLLASRLQLDVQAARLFANKTDTGTVNEEAWRQFLRPLLPSRYEVGVGEVIAPDEAETEALAQSGQKDVLVYDPFVSSVFSWGTSGIGLFPVESIYSAMEVKTCFNKGADVQQAAKQVYEVKKMAQRLCSTHEPPLTVIVAFSTRIAGRAVFEAVQGMPVPERPDFTLFLGSQEDGMHAETGYVCHWHYVRSGFGEIGFVTATEAEGYLRGSDKRLMLLTLGETANALLWFYLFLIAKLQAMDSQLDRSRCPNSFAYAQSNEVDLGWKHNEPAELGE